MDDARLEIILVLTGPPADAEALVEEIADRIDADVMGVGELVGWDLTAGRATLHVDGDDAARLTSIILPLLMSLPPEPGSHLRAYNGQREQRIELRPGIGEA